MQFHVPQFIETEDRIIGPLTLKQFMYIAVGGGICFISFLFLNTALWIIFTFIISLISGALAFLKINGRPLPIIILAAFKFYWKPRLFLWQKIEPQETLGYKEMILPKKPFSLVTNLWQQLTTAKAPLPKREKILGQPILDRIKTSRERFEIIRRITGERETARRVDYR